METRTVETISTSQGTIAITTDSDRYTVWLNGTLGYVEMTEREASDIAHALAKGIARNLISLTGLA